MEAVDTDSLQTVTYSSPHPTALRWQVRVTRRYSQLHRT